jgi:hypothetical protein
MRRVRVVLTLLLLAAEAEGLALVPSRNATIPECDATSATTACVSAALEQVGAVAFTNWPGLAEARLKGLSAVASCDKESGMRTVSLPDGTSRRSIGARSLHGVTSPLSACQAVSERVAELRAIVEKAARSFLGLLQPLQGGEYAMLANGDPYQSLAAVANAGVQLEHFHIYEPPAAATADAHVETTATHATHVNEPSAHAVPLHTDAGLFIALVPAVHLPRHEPEHSQASASTAASGDNAERDGFYVESRDGAPLRLSADAHATSVVVLLGEAWRIYLNPQLKTALRPAPHAMEMRADGGGERLRAWYGRMYLPPTDARDLGGAPPFATWADHLAAPQAPSGRRRAAAGAMANTSSLADASGILPLATHPTGTSADEGASTLMLDASACFEDQVFCWMQCMCAATSPHAASLPATSPPTPRHASPWSVSASRPAFPAPVVLMAASAHPRLPRAVWTAGASAICHAAARRSASTLQRGPRGMGPSTAAAARSHAHPQRPHRPHRRPRSRLLSSPLPSGVPRAPQPSRILCRRRHRHRRCSAPAWAQTCR